MPSAARNRALLLAAALLLALVATWTGTPARGQSPASGESAWEQGRVQTAAAPRAELAPLGAWSAPDVALSMPDAERAAPEIAQADLPRLCRQIRFSDTNDLQLTLTDADLLASGDGSRACLFYDTRWDSYSVWLLNQGSLAQFRQTKALFQPLLAAAGIDPCRIGFWTSVDRTLQRMLTRPDRQDAGTRCEPDVISQGSLGAARATEVRAALAEITAAAEGRFGWALVWPLRVYIYDDHPAFVRGMQVEGGDDKATATSLRTTFGSAGVIANGMTGFLVDLSRFPQSDDLKMLAAHEYAHIAQTGATGCTCSLPFFVSEGGAEWFASTIVGVEQRDLAARLAEAVTDEQRGRATPLRELIRKPAESDRARTAAGYSRGYAALRLLADRWGEESITRLHAEHLGGTPEGFVASLARVTGLSLDAFDQQVGRYLRERAGIEPSPPPSPAPTRAPVATAGPSVPANGASTTLAPGSALVWLNTYRALADGSLQEAARFARTDRSVLIRFEWSCLDATVQGEARIFAPNGNRFSTFSGTSGPGCGERLRLEFDLDDSSRGAAPRAFPGQWRVEVFADGVLHGTVTFVLGN